MSVIATTCVNGHANADRYGDGSCKACRQKYARSYRSDPVIRERLVKWHADNFARNKETMLAKQRAYGAKPETKQRRREWLKEYRSRPEVRERSLKARAAHTAAAMRNHRLKNYGLTYEQQDKAIARTGGKCEACGVVLVKMCFDHDHNTGNFRGILCDTCNRFEGYIAKSPERYGQIMAYLKRYG